MGEIIPEESPEFFRGRERPAHLKATRAPRRGSGAGSPRTVTKFKIVKRFKILEKESIVQEFQHFSGPKIHFSNKNSDKGTDFTKISEIVRKIIFKISTLQFLYGVNPEKFPINAFIDFVNLSKNSRKFASASRRTIGNGMKISEKIDSTL